MIENLKVHLTTVLIVFVFVFGLVVTTIRIESALDKKIDIDHAILERIELTVTSMTNEIKGLDKRIVRLETIAETKD